MEPATGWCRGCLRTIDEIAAWGTLDDDARRAVLQALPSRRRAWRARQAAATGGPAGQGPRPATG